jgi:alpha-tubulin suppressor-like RCC1 family protein
VTTDHVVFSWGANNFGQLGQDHTNALNAPTQIPSLIGKNIVNVSS